MLKIKSVIWLSLILFLLTSLSTARDWKGLADVEVYFNDQNETVDNVSLRVGEPFYVKVVIQPKKEICFGVALSASGFKEDEPQPYQITKGEGKFGGPFVNYGCNLSVGDTYDYEWIIQPTNVWAGGNAPLNIDLDFYDKQKQKDYPLYFTVANIYISKETYAGAVAPASVFSIPPTGNVTAQKQPGFEAALAVAGLATVVFMMRKKR